MHRLQPLGLVQGKGALPASLLKACHDERLVGGLSVSLRATPDEVAVWLANAMGGALRSLRLLDVRGTRLDVQCGELTETWDVPSVDALIQRLNEFAFEHDDVKGLAVLGEFEGMLQVWALRLDVLDVLLETSLLAGCRNRETFD